MTMLLFTFPPGMIVSILFPWRDPAKCQRINAPARLEDENV
jgi:hypothetical protein